MDSLTYSPLKQHWQRKLVAFLAALVVWFSVNHSITSSKTIPAVPIRVINIPTDKAVQGLLPNGFLSKRTSLTLIGTKRIIDQLEPGDVEILLDLSLLPNGGPVQVTKKNLVSLNPHFSLAPHVTAVSHPEFLIRLSPLLTERVPILIHSPIGTPPEGYEFLDIWPLVLTQTVTGPQEQVLSLKNQGLELTFDLGLLSQSELDGLEGTAPYEDEITFKVPPSWKKVAIPFSTHGIEMINDPKAKELQLTFLRREYHSLPHSLPIHLFYPLKSSAAINPETYPLRIIAPVQSSHHLPVLDLPLLAAHTSKLFLEVVQDHMELTVIAAPTRLSDQLEWSVTFVDLARLEEDYVTFMLTHPVSSHRIGQDLAWETHLRQRFSLYARRFALYLSQEIPLNLQAHLERGSIRLTLPFSSPLVEKKDAR